VPNPITGKIAQENDPWITGGFSLVGPKHVEGFWAFDTVDPSEEISVTVERIDEQEINQFEWYYYFTYEKGILYMRDGLSEEIAAVFHRE
jgi:hypothetical protein